MRFVLAKCWTSTPIWRWPGTWPAWSSRKSTVKLQVLEGEKMASRRDCSA